MYNALIILCYMESTKGDCAKRRPPPRIWAEVVDGRAVSRCYGDGEWKLGYMWSSVTVSCEQRGERAWGKRGR